MKDGFNYVARTMNIVLINIHKFHSKHLSIRRIFNEIQWQFVFVYVCTDIRFATIDSYLRQIDQTSAKANELCRKTKNAFEKLHHFPLLKITNSLIQSNTILHRTRFLRKRVRRLTMQMEHFKVKVKFSLSLTKYHVMKTYEGVEV